MNIPLPDTISNYNEAKFCLRQLRDFEFNLFRQGRNERAHFRGEEDIAYTLRPKIARFGRTEAELATIEPQLMNEFKLVLKQQGLYAHIREGFLALPFHEEWLFYEQAQHLGLATRFLDWTLKYEVALFFACKNLPQTDGKIHIYVPRSDVFQADRKGDNYANSAPYNIAQPVFLNPYDFADDSSFKKFGQRFRARQHGRFLVTPLKDAIVDMTQGLVQSSFFHTVTIQHSAKQEILNRIDVDEAITQETLFLEDNPDAVNFKTQLAPIIADLHKKYLS
jgi:hypothetical protein